MQTPLPDPTAIIDWVSIADMKVSDLAQRKVNLNKVAVMVANFNPEMLGIITVNFRDGAYQIIDGQHRVLTLRELGWGDQKMLARTYTGMTEQQEADMFLELNTVLPITGFERFRVGVTAERHAESAVSVVCEALGLHVSLSKNPGAIRAPSTLLAVYARGGQELLRRTLTIIRDAYGDAGLEAAVISGIAGLLHRYGDQIDDDKLIRKLTESHGGVSGLLNKAEVMRRMTGKARWMCVAAAAVEILNSGSRGGYRLADWWKKVEHAERIERAERAQQPAAS